MLNFRAFPLIVAGLIAATAAVPASAALIGQSTATAQAALKEWNVIAFNNLDTSHHIEGRILAGTLDAKGNFEAQSKNLSTTSYGTGLVTVTGNAKFNAGNTKIEGTGSVVNVGGVASGTIEGRNGTVKVGSSSAPTIVNNSMTVQTQASDFTSTLNSQMSDIKSSLTSLSANLKALSTTSNVQFLAPAGSASTNENQNSPYWNTNEIKVTGTGLAVLNLTEDQFEKFGASQKDIKVTLPDGATLVVNVAGTAIDYSGKVNLFTNDQNVVWNFYQAQTINLQNQFSGAVLGVFADITIGNANFDGTVVGNNVKQNSNGELHNQNYFQGDLSSVGTSGGGPVSVAPEPATWAMLILGFGLIGVMMRRRGIAVPQPQL